MLPELDIFVGNYTLIDKEAYDLWIEGYSIQEAVGVMKQRGVLETWGANMDLLISDVADNYRTFDMLEKLLPTPLRLAEDWTFQLHPSVQKYVIEKYYSFDGTVIREILGKKLSGRTRKDLDDVAEKTGITLRSCRRQFDNVKRIYKQTDDASGSVKLNIQASFLLPPALAQKYATVVFLTSNRFETSKRRLSYLTFEDFSKCASAMMVHWTSSEVSEGVDDCDLEREFLVRLRDLKIVLEREKEHRNVTLSHLRGKIPDRMCLEVENNLKTYSRALISIAVNLINNRDLKDFFVNVVEKFIEPCKQGRWKPEELECFLKVYTDAGSNLDVMSSDVDLKPCWERYMKVMQICIRQLYHS
ncbi:Acidic fibroblast growth factor intracellular-binding protein [Armadillidium nasatum]|uniref:Acidic fibroblast growth factor intracellular-binding protein n=1 Tax=Armadillidium nasatum TaxID=96803 RepID=A0A5N5SW39_9CRUS|nr:Acidic fibroblast growth factor intracellular-binding protein [Armadillidium nasatum]